MQILVTGGCGFVGANLIAQMNREGLTSIRVFDNESLGKRERLGSSQCEFVHGRLRDKAALSRAMKDIDTVVHLVADTQAQTAGAH